jgi:hypothetical protein
MTTLNSKEDLAVAAAWTRYCERVAEPAVASGAQMPIAEPDTPCRLRIGFALPEGVGA